MTKIFIELPLELGCVTYTGIIGTCNCLEVSMSHEDSAISKPARSRLFKLIDRNVVMRWSSSKR